MKPVDYEALDNLVTDFHDLKRYFNIRTIKEVENTRLEKLNANEGGILML